MKLVSDGAVIKSQEFQTLKSMLIVTALYCK